MIRRGHFRILGFEQMQSLVSWLVHKMKKHIDNGELVQIHCRTIRRMSSTGHIVFCHAVRRDHPGGSCG